MLRTLPVEQQTLLELYYWEDLEIADLATIFEASANAIRIRLHRARQALRERLGQRRAAARKDQEIARASGIANLTMTRCGRAAHRAIAAA